MAPLRQSNLNAFLIPSSLPPAASAARSAPSATTRAPAAEAPDVQYMGTSSATAGVGKPPKTEAKAAVKAKAATKAKADVKGKAKDKGKGKGKEKEAAPPKKRRKVAEDEGEAGEAGTVEEGERAEEGAAGEPTAFKLLDFEPINPVRPVAATLPWPTTVGQPAFDAADTEMDW